MMIVIMQLYALSKSKLRLRSFPVFYSLQGFLSSPRGLQKSNEMVSFVFHNLTIFRLFRKNIDCKGRWKKKTSSTKKTKKAENNAICGVRKQKDSCSPGEALLFFFFGATLMKREFQSHYCSRFAHNEGTKEKNYFLIWEAVLQPGQSRQLYILIQITSKSNDEVADYITLSYYPHPILTYN